MTQLAPLPAQGAAGAPQPPLLRVAGLRVEFPTRKGIVRAVDGVDFTMGKGEALGLVGESGSGKTATALSLLRLLPPPGRIAGGRVELEGTDLLALAEREMRKVRGARIALVPQEPMTSLNPVHTVGAQLAEAIRAHRAVSRQEARAEAVELLRKVQIPAPESRVDEYPHRLSGGMRQRVMIAMALASRPRLLIADEPTTALDVTIQDQVLRLLEDLRREMSLSVLLVTHNLALVAGFADRVAVLYAGKVVETGSVAEVFESPLHPYTRALLASIPRPGLQRGERLPVIPGTVPDPLHFPSGCRFHPRCPVKVAVCESEDPDERDPAPGRRARCHLVEPWAGSGSASTAGGAPGAREAGP